jgi:hypothetical protein
MPWYRVGSVAITAGQNTVTGTGTNFSTNARVGDAFQGPDGRWYEVTNIASATVLSILPAYQGATVSGGAYGLAPMQGYNKTLTDAVNGLVNQWGATLALFGGATTVAAVRQNILAAARGANSDITSLTGLTTALSVAQGGTGGKTQVEARTGLGLKAAAVADIVGSVSQSGGVPTGAIVERGSNANGEYTRYADGTQICFWEDTVSVQTNSGAYGPLNYYAYKSVNYPMPFVGVPVTVPCCRYAGAENGVTMLGLATCQRGTNLGTSLMAQGGTTTAGGRMGYIATGRWF